MMFRLNKRIGAILVIVLTMFLAACGGGNNTGGNKNENKTGNTSKDQVTLELFNQKSEIQDLLDDVIADFEEENPDIRVEQIHVPDSRTVLYSRLSTGDAPDIMSIFPNESDFETQANDGYFMDLTDKDFMDNIDQQFLDDVKLDGKDYSAPLTVNGYGIFYNAEKFEELGLSIPETWDDFDQLVADIKDEDLIPFATSFKEQWTTGHLSEALLANLGPADEVAEMFSSADTDSPYFEMLLDKMDFVKENSQKNASGHEVIDAVSLFTQEEALMFPQGIWSVPTIEQGEPDFEYKMFPFPNDEGQGNVAYGIDYSLSISSDTDHPEEAEKFLAFMTETETAQYIQDNEQSPSTIVDVSEDVFEGTEGVTSLIFDEDRSVEWFHFEWAPGLDPSWQAMTQEYFIDTNRDVFEEVFLQEFAE